MANTYKALSTVTVGAGGAAGIFFTNIPQTYTDLVVVWSARTSAGTWGATSYIYYNDTISTGRRVFAGGTSVIPSTVNNIETPGNSATANTFGYTSVYISNYNSNNNNKSISSNWALENNSATDNYLGFNASIYSSNAPITSISIFPNATNTYLQYSTFTLYGVFNADVSSAPATPTIGTATAGTSGDASITFTGVSNAASYTMTSTPDTLTATGTTSPIVVTGLRNGVSYSFKAKSNNPFGSSAESAASNSITAVSGLYDSIATVTVGAGGASSITFSGIPSTYKNLQIRGMDRNGRGFGGAVANICIQFNSDTGSNYGWAYGWYGNGGTISAYSNINQTYGLVGSSMGASSPTSYFSATVADIYDYADSNKYKTYKSLSSCDYNQQGGSEIVMFSGQWRNTSAITSITLTAQGAGTQNFLQYSTYALYGIKG